MSNETVLIIVNSVYQLLTAIHMKWTILNPYPVELLITDVTPGLVSLREQLISTKLFLRVLSGSVKDLNETIKKSEKEMTEVFKRGRTVLRWQLSEELADYREIYFSNFDFFARLLAHVYYDHPCRFLWYEDGFSSYVIDYLKEERSQINKHAQGREIRDKVEKALHYEPRLARRGDKIPNMRLPKINPKDIDFIEMLNNIFQYQKPEHDPAFVFLEQSFRAEGISGNELFLMEQCKNAVAANAFAVKPHPRNEINLPFNLGLTPKYEIGAPWELYLLNEQNTDKTILTICSNAALSAKLVLDLDIPTVMLYRLYDGKVLWKEDDVLKRYLEQFRIQFAGNNYYVPKTIYELKHILKYLGGQK